MPLMPQIERSARIAVIASALSSDARAAATTARSMGFGGMLFDAYSLNLSIPELSQTGRREFRHVLASQDLQIVALRADLGAKGFGPGADVDRLIQKLDRAMETAAGLASPLACIDLGPLPEPIIATKPKPAITPEQAGLIILPTAPVVAEEPSPRAASPADAALESSVNAALTELGVRADRYRVTVALSSSLASFAAVERAIAACRCPWFGVDLDPVAMVRDDWDADEIFSRLGALIRHVRGRDAVRGADRRTKPSIIGQGSVDWPALVHRLDASGYKSWLTVDPIELADRLTGARVGIEYLRSLL
jgi:sugar phosphate isomerase/epimerase